MTDTKNKERAKRVTIYKADDGWRYRVQAQNWRVIETADRPRAGLAACRRVVVSRWPGVEIVVER